MHALGPDGVGCLSFLFNRFDLIKNSIVVAWKQSQIRNCPTKGKPKSYVINIMNRNKFPEKSAVNRIAAQNARTDERNKKQMNILTRRGRKMDFEMNPACV